MKHRQAQNGPKDQRLDGSPEKNRKNKHRQGRQKTDRAQFRHELRSSLEVRNAPIMSFFKELENNQALDLFDPGNISEFTVYKLMHLTGAFEKGLCHDLETTGGKSKVFNLRQSLQCIRDGSRVSGNINANFSLNPETEFQWIRDGDDADDTSLDELIHTLPGCRLGKSNLLGQGGIGHSTISLQGENDRPIDRIQHGLLFRLTRGCVIFQMTSLRDFCFMQKPQS